MHPNLVVKIYVTKIFEKGPMPMGELTNTIHIDFMAGQKSKMLESSQVVPESLRLKVSPLWLKCLALLHKSSFPTSSIQAMLNDSRLKDSGHSKAESWEEILVALTEEDAVIHREKLMLQPVFFSLPKLVQTRFLHLVQRNASKICGHHLKLFVSKLETTDIAKSHWTDFYISNLRQHLNADSHSNDLISSQTLENYTFCAASKVLLANLSKDQSISSDAAQISRGATLKSSSDMEVKVVDVTIEDSSDNNEDTPNLTTKTSLCNKKTSPQSRQPRNSDLFVTSKNDGSAPIEVMLTSANKSYPDSPLARDVKRKFTASKRFNVGSNREESVISISDEENSEPALKVSKSSTQSELDIVHHSPADCQTACQDEPVAQLSDTIKANLIKLKEACFGENETAAHIASKLSFLPALSLAELEKGTEFLKLGECVEESLIPFCEAVPWTKLDLKCAFVLIHGCVFDKVATSQSQISRTLLTFLSAVMKDQPQAVLDLLIKTVNIQSNEYQCQMVATLCKEAMTPEWMCNFIKQLNEELVVEVDANVLSVLQAVVNRQPDLDPVTLTLLLALLARSGQVAANSPTLGKCLMACLTKYCKQMTPDNIATLSTLVDTHSSNFRNALRAALKRINR